MSIVHSSPHIILDRNPLPPKNEISRSVRSEYFKIATPHLYEPNVPINKTKLPDPKICIIGAGMSGLFAALLFDIAGLNNIEVFECQDRVGGRVLTKYFSDDTKNDKLYGEFGAMRLPKGTNDSSHGHQMVFDTIDYLNCINKDDIDYEKEYKIELINFIFDDDKLNGRYFYNNKRDQCGNIMTQGYADNPANFDTLGFTKSVDNNYRQLYEASLKDFFDDLDKDIFKGVEKLMDVDDDSVYTYLKRYLIGKVLKKDIDDTIAAMETTESATGLFRLAFTEAVMDGYTFLHKDQEWETIKYGMQRFPNAFKPTLEKKRNYIKYNRKVCRLKDEGDKGVRVFWEGEGVHEKNYDRVIVTCPFGVVCQWELDKLDNCEKIDILKRRAIRELNYDNAAKIFLRFKSRFWEDPKKTDNKCIVGGNSSTDLPIRKVIYPSYYVGDPIDKEAILLGSYTWANDAAKYAPYSQEKNVNLCLEKLQILHPEVNLKKDEWVHDNDPCHGNSSIYWPNEPTAAGAYAYFGPNQYKELLYPMLKESNSNIHWAGEHTDIHHAWIIGALNSAVRVVKEVLIQTGNECLWEKLLHHELLRHWEWKPTKTTKN
ncbi:hypothetical protein GLOIN_2v1834010 [Rhizophagus irregularis DAOM 181602=DAOM 197198]|uniref:Amine oxidase domain-containing protein n=1 Tax=Rhizophagus irregularis (strain DAOM 181602 / DAOM 197198 / MUCL 43194) TaxID=747089 RepID=A0A2P4QZ58_RHIID|nr:hypothetical protein GLOIN_2v1834010 [Rhizophagus irregularis DAOM 181602=DAOM 197198]POG82929.1 hypothetical protein GLOIN_2v1834010 [Rhizophagus irregularis DAOM 181602=DAOM 197198]CAG8689181.1 5940_t:CDS:2 [Rhizophagus irregularis]|eukprot:XP_025189795.1 hypothetical protein GLOIN_2v1834010 [Rhizophagus irregularis DAOM 181602=DAOM 197198]